MFRVYALVVVVGLVGGAVWGGYTYYKDTQQRISTLTQNNAKLKSANETNNATIDQLQQNAVALNKLIDDLGTDFSLNIIPVQPNGYSSGYGGVNKRAVGSLKPNRP